MIMSGYSWAEVLSWLIGLLVLYEVLVYVIFTFGKKLTETKKKGFELDDGSGEETTESRIAKIDEMDDSSYENNEYYEISDELFAKDTGQRREEADEPIESDVGVNIDTGQVVETSPPLQNEEEDGDKNLPINVETESTTNTDEIEKNFEDAESDIFYSDNEIISINNDLFSVENVIQTDVLGDSVGADSGNVQNFTSELIETEVDKVNIEKKDINFEGCEPFDSFDFKSLSGELERIKEKSTQYVESLLNINDKEPKKHDSDQDYDETPEQEIDEE